MTKLLIIGDVHARVEDLDECKRLMDFALRAEAAHNPDYVVFLGDTHHNHAVVRVEVMKFWRGAFGKFKKPVIALVGNHDTSTSTDAHALLAHDDLVQVVDCPVVKFGPDILFLPYYSNNDEFVKACNEVPQAKVLICHQTFQGASYDNGFYAGDGIDINLIPQKLIISGHIHSQQYVGSNCWYPGSPRWMTLGDANVEKAIWIVELDGSCITNKIPLSTYEICRPIRALVETPESEFNPASLEANVDYVVDLRGSSAWVQQRLAAWQDKARIRTFPVEEATTVVRESDGISIALAKYINAFEPKYGTDKETLAKMARERIGANCFD